MLLIVEIVLPGANQPSPGKLMDLIMLVNRPSRWERTLKEYRDLLAMAGFRHVRVLHPPPRLVRAAEAIPAAAAMEHGLAQDCQAHAEATHRGRRQMFIVGRAGRYCPRRSGRTPNRRRSELHMTTGT
jgi:hypothetical protein